MSAASDHACQLLPSLRGWGLCVGLDDLGEVSQVVGVDSIGFCQEPVSPGESPHPSRVDDGYGEGWAQLVEGQLFIAPGCFQDDEAGLAPLEKIRQRVEPLGAVGELPGPVVVAEGEIEVVFRDVDSGEELGWSGHGETSLCILIVPALVRYSL
jgi:hypothetical protein